MAQYQYGTSPKKLKMPLKSKKKTPYLIKTTNKAKTKIQKKPNFVLIMSVVLTMLFIIIYRNSIINETFSNLQALKKQVTSLQKDNDQLEINIQNSINLNNIETSAKEMLGMKKLTNAQTKYIKLEKDDHIEITAESVVIEDEENYFIKLKNKVINLF